MLRALLLALSTLLIVLIAGLLGRRFFLVPIGALAEAARRFGEGQFSTRVKLAHRPGELGELAHAFDRMASGIERRQTELQRVNRLLGVLSEGNRAMLRASSEQALMDAMCRLLVERGGCCAAWIESEKEHGAVKIAARHVSEAAWASSDEPAAFPLRVDGQHVGVLQLTYAGRKSLDQQELGLLQETADDLAFGLNMLRLRARNAQAEADLRRAHQHIAFHVSQTPLAVIEFNLACEVIEWNASAERMFGFSRNEALGRHASFIVPEAARPTIHARWQDLMARHGAMRSSNENVTREGRTIFCEWYNTVLADEAGEIVGIASLVQDITREKENAEALRGSEERFRLFAEQSRDGIFIMAPTEERLIYVSPAVERMWGIPAPEWYREPRRWVAAVSAEDRPRIVAAWEQWLKSDGGDLAVEFRINRPDGTMRWVAVRCFVIRDDEGAVRYLSGVVRDITGDKQHQAHLEYLSTHDELTQLPNRALLLDRIEQALPTARRAERCAAVLAVNPDRLKNVNETLGHAAGDALLVAFATRLSERVRPGDTVARVGSDDFVVFLADLRKSEDAGLFAEQLLEALCEPFDAAGNTLSVAVSIGIAVFPQDASDADALLRQADAALHTAKRDGGRAVRFFAEELSTRVRQTLRLEQALGGATRLGQLFLQYQPQVDLATGRIFAAEALVRWRHPEFGLVSPGSFIALAEETGQILEIGEWVLREACRQGVRWLEDGLPPITICVNVSARQFWDARFRTLVEGVLRDTGLPAELLELEVTESVVMRNAPETIATLAALKSCGLGIAVDDFGTGYSSLAYLRRFPIDRLKIDRSFVSELASDPKAATLVHSVIELAKGLGFSTVAEGVETAQEARMLRDLHCDAVQGFLIARPIDPDAFAALLRSNPVYDPAIGTAA